MAADTSTLASLSLTHVYYVSFLLSVDVNETPPLTLHPLV